jgi:hypothetical protein
MVEARQKVDQFDGRIHSEGVIVYSVQTSDPLGHPQNVTPPIKLLTTTALTVGQTFTSDTGITVQINNVLPGGFSISINTPVATVPDVLGLSGNKAAHEILQKGLVPNLTGHGGWVDEQNPHGGDVVALGSIVRLHTRTGVPP